MDFYGYDCKDSGITTNIVAVKNSFFKLNSTSNEEIDNLGMFSYGAQSSTPMIIENSTMIMNSTNSYSSGPINTLFGTVTNCTFILQLETL